MKLPEKKYTYSEIGFFGDFIQFFTIPAVRIVSRWCQNPNWVTSLNYVLSGVILWSLVEHHFVLAGYIVIAVRFIDQIDGYLARYLDKCTLFGYRYDALADFVAWLSCIVGIYLYSNSSLCFFVLVAYALDTYEMVLLGEGHPTEADATAQTGLQNVSVVQKLWRWCRLFLHHNDSMALLGVVLIVNPYWLDYWLIYEISRHGIRAVVRAYQLFLVKNIT